MKYLFLILYILAAICFKLQIFAQNMTTCSTSTVTSAPCGSSGVLIYAPGSSSTTFAPPSTTLSIGKLQITYSVTLDASSTSGFSYDATKWGILFGTPGSGAPTLAYYPGGSSLASNVTVSVDTTRVFVTGSVYAGTVIVTVDFTSASSILSSDITSLISSGSLKIQPLYVNSGTNVTNASLAFNWQADTGAMLYGPSISVQAQDSAFIVNLSAPSNLNAAVVSTTDPTKLTATTNPNSLSGYVIVYWLDTDAKGNATGCKANPGGWQFPMNPIAFNTATVGAPTTCTYTQYQTSFNTGGNSNALGCPSSAITGILTFDNTISAPALTADSTAIPYTPSYTNPSQLPSDSNGLPSGCYHVVYVPNSQSSWSKGNINNGDIYGVVAWALNSAYNTTTNTVSPNYSLAHSNISYITGVNFPLASLDKDPNLSKTTDCFVVTAASGNPNSQSVFYWRIIRDEYLTPMGITPFYYQHAKTWAKWLDEHPSIKPPLNIFFEYSGKIIYHTSGYVKKLKELLNSFMKNLENIWEKEAGAQELPTPLQMEQPISKQETEQPTHTVDENSVSQTEQPNLKSKKELEDKELVVSDETANENSFHQPRYDIFITGGVLFPTDDKVYYHQYYSSQMTAHIEAGSNYIFWLGNIGLSAGLLGRYMMNNNNSSITVLGTQQQYTLNFYSLTAEALVGLRYRHPCWSYLQPGIFAGVGVTRFREEASTGGNNSSSSSTGGSGNKPIGVTNYSRVFEFGGNLDINLIPLFSVTPRELGYFLRDVALRLSVSYNINPTPALSSTGLFVQSGFVFLLN